jgi:hypothetical protein
MENTIQTEKQNKEEIQFRDAFADEYWSKEYDISFDELKKTANIGLSDTIIAAGIKHKTFEAQQA